MYKKGDGVEKDDKMSEKYRNRAEQLRAEVEVTRLEAEENFTPT